MPLVSALKTRYRLRKTIYSPVDSLIGSLVRLSMVPLVGIPVAKHRLRKTVYLPTGSSTR